MQRVVTSVATALIELAITAGVPGGSYPMEWNLMDMTI